MNLLNDSKFDLLVLKGLLDHDNVYIDIFKPDRSFIIEGQIIQGSINNNLVLESDKICLRYSLFTKDFIDLECYGNGRMVWMKLTMKQFNKIKYYLAQIQ